MAEKSKQVTKAGTCPTHGSVQAVKEVPVYTPPGLFYVVRSVGTPFKPYRCPQCGAKTS